MATETLTTLHYRILPPEEWGRLKEIYPVDKPMPSPEVAVAVVAERGGELVGALFLQAVLHMEPLILLDPNVNWLHMERTLEGALPAGVMCFAFAADHKVGRMAELAGFKELDWSVFYKEVTCHS